MEFWLTFNNKAESLQLPVPPADFTIKKGTAISVVNVNDFGELALIGKEKLSSIEIATFFPAQFYPFCQYRDFPNPYECVKMIESWRKSGKPLRLIITETDVNLACCIESFTYGEQDGTRDVYFTLSLKEYRFIDQMQVATNSLSLTYMTANRQTEKQTPKTYTVKSGDTLWGIAKKLFGDGSKYTQIASKNTIKDVNLIYPGQVLKL
jgi:nucleoid-associated protein YgaU